MGWKNKKKTKGLNEILYILNRNGRYTALNHGSKSVSEDGGGEYMEMEKKSRDRALSICRDYIDKTPRFALIKQLNNIGEPLPIALFWVENIQMLNKNIIRYLGKLPAVFLDKFFNRAK